MAINGKNSALSLSKNYLLLFLLFLLFLGSGLLLFPVYRDYRARQGELYQLKNELAELRAQRDARQREADALEHSPAAVEKVARERFKLVRPGENVMIYAKPDKSGR